MNLTVATRHEAQRGAMRQPGEDVQRLTRGAQATPRQWQHRLRQRPHRTKIHGKIRLGDVTDEAAIKAGLEAFETSRPQITAEWLELRLADGTRSERGDVSLVLEGLSLAPEALDNLLAVGNGIENRRDAVLVIALEANQQLRGVPGAVTAVNTGAAQETGA